MTEPIARYFIKYGFVFHISVIMVTLNVLCDILLLMK